MTENTPTNAELISEARDCADRRMLSAKHPFNRLADALEAVTAERDALAARRVLHYSGTLPNAPIRNARPEGFDDASWHEAASADTGTSYVPLTRVSVVACEWCDQVFVAENAGAALAMFREHEEERARTAFEAAAPERAAADARREARRAEREAQR